MNVAALFMNLERTETKMWNFHGDFTTDEKEQFDNMMAQYGPATRPGGGWNYWIINKYSNDGRYYVSRFTWEMVWSGSFDEIVEMMKRYHGPEEQETNQ